MFKYRYGPDERRVMKSTDPLLRSDVRGLEPQDSQEDAFPHNVFDTAVEDCMGGPGYLKPSKACCKAARATCKKACEPKKKDICDSSQGGQNGQQSIPTELCKSHCDKDYASCEAKSEGGY